MRRIGLIGGTTWLSTGEYYKAINLMVNERLGGDEFAELTLESLNFGALRRTARERGGIEANEPLLVEAGKRLAESGVAGIGLCANTMHLFAEAIARASGLPIIHIAKAVSKEIAARGLQKVGLLGTKATMERDIYFSVLSQAGIDCAVPEAIDREMIEDSIFTEFAHEIFCDKRRSAYLEVIEKLRLEGAEGVILGCTEIPLLLSPEQIPIPSFNTIEIHSTAIVDFMLSG